MSRGRTVIDCKTAEEVDRALYLGHTARFPEDVARQLGMDPEPDGKEAFTDEELEEAWERPYGDEEPPPPGTEYEHILGLAEAKRAKPEPPRDEAMERSPAAVRLRPR